MSQGKDKRAITKRANVDDNDYTSEESEDIVHDLETLNPKLFHGIPNPKRDKIVAAFRLVQHKSYSGPLPQAEDLEKYDVIIPNGADRIMKMAEKQQEHRIEIEKYAVPKSLSQSRTGQIMGFCVFVIGMGAMFYGMKLGYPWPSVLIGLSTLASLVYAFIRGK